ncbi:ParB/RepB/Spo0J family partition protein [Methylomicrobium sp. RS1]|uniref:ParB/RepB/Spo0J family partition protein n=1 Tax=Candidatus Methylomicrobium oryzae TaxID=2802053 RepID=UPI00192286E4|nr:ParB/RepB/Spo0J family partition protein [Methylomicrobium sp. RS1]MBL1265477.1 ParB/RepB/Spo0J family partition protein [Methylomicrobium sp. RS1]
MINATLNLGILASSPQTLPVGKHCLINVDQIKPNPHQPRTHYSKESLDNLVHSIRENGLLQPIIVQKTETGYQLIAGERRWRAHLILNKPQIEAIVRTVDDQNQAIYALAENIVREDLSDYEIGKAIRSIEDEFPNKKNLAAAIGINRTDMYRYLAFDSLPEFILNDLNGAPTLLSRTAAEQIKKMLGQHKNSDSVVSFLETAWTLLKEGELQQTQITRFIEKKLQEVYELNQTATENVLLNENGSQLGRVNQTEKYWTVHLNVAGVNEHQREQILNFIRKLLNEQSGSVAS